MKTVKQSVSYIFSASFYAFGIYGITSAIYFLVADRNVLVATIWNMAMIIYFIILEKVEYYFYNKLKTRETDKKFKLPLRIYNAYLKWSVYGGASFKSAMYFFYIVVTIYNALVAAEPSLAVRVIPDDYLLSVRYGILVLIAADKFMEQIFKDIKADEKLG